MIYFYDKDKIKSAIKNKDVFNLVGKLGGEPEATSFGFVARTICHNPIGEGSRKLYYYNNSNLFNCYTNCGSMDIFSFVSEVQETRTGKPMTFYQSMDYLVKFFGLNGVANSFEDLQINTDEKIMAHYNSLPKPREKLKLDYNVYNGDLLKRLSYVKPQGWIDEGITEEVLEKYGIKYYGTEHKIVIPHHNVHGDLIGIRARSLVQEDVEKYGKYMPIQVNGVSYSHPLSYNLYGLNFNLKNILKAKKIIIFEGE